MKLELLNGTAIRVGDHTPKLSSKGLALVTYLILEPGLHSRSELAALLWDHEGSVANLRVELAKLRAAGIRCGGARAPQLSLEADTDLGEWLSADPTGDETSFVTWLHTLRSLPLDDLKGSSVHFGHWVQAQRRLLRGRIAAALGAALRHPGLPPGRRTDLLHRAATLGLTIDAQTAPTRWAGPPRGPLAHRLLDVLERALRHPQLLWCTSEFFADPVLSLEDARLPGDWLRIEVEGVPQEDLLLASLTMQLAAQVPSEVAPRLRALLASPTTFQRDLVRFSACLLQISRPLLIVVRHAERLPASACALIAYLMNYSSPLVLALCSVRLQTQGPGDLLADYAHAPWFTHLESPPLAISDVLASDPACSLTQGARLVQQAEGQSQVAQVLRGLLGQGTQRPRLPEPLRDTLLQLLQRRCADDLPHLAVLAALPMPFEPAMAWGALDGLDAHAAEELLRRALRHRVLEPCPRELCLTFPELRVRLPDEDAPLIFRSELMRAALAATLTARERLRLRPYAALHADFEPPTHHATDSQAAVAPPLFGRGLIRTSSLPGGYRLNSGAHGLSILHLGRQGARPPLLRLRFPVPRAAGPCGWTLSYSVPVPDAHGPGPFIGLWAPAVAGMDPADVCRCPVPGAAGPSGWQRVRGLVGGGALDVLVWAPNAVVHLLRPEFLAVSLAAGAPGRSATRSHRAPGP